MARRYPMLVFQSGVDYQHVNPDLLARLNKLATAMRITITVTSGYRTYAQQAALYDKYQHGGNIAAPPGHSEHESGNAVDTMVNGTYLGNYWGAKSEAILQHYGLSTIYNAKGQKFDPGHIQLEGSPQTLGSSKTSVKTEKPAVPPEQPASLSAPTSSGVSVPDAQGTQTDQTAPMPAGAPTPLSPVQPEETVPSLLPPGSAGLGIDSVAQQWRLIASQPMSSPDSQAFADQLSQAMNQ